MTKIEWTERTWNPIVGCSIVSPGCTNCYAMRMAARLENMSVANEARTGGDPGPLYYYRGLTQESRAGWVWTGKVKLAPEDVLLKPLRRRKPTMWFVNSMSDLFHEDVPDEWIDRVFAVMALGWRHTYQVLTKRSARMRAYFNDPHTNDRIGGALAYLSDELDRRGIDNEHPGWGFSYGPFSSPDHVWLGVSVERQQEADERIPDLLATPASIRFVSAEPLLGPIDFTSIKGVNACPDQAPCRKCRTDGSYGHSDRHLHGLDWIIVGGESGPGARPMHPAWARSIRDQCASAGVPFFFKQWGSWAPTSGVDVYCHGHDRKSREFPTSEGIAWLADGRICMRDFTVREHHERMRTRIAASTRAVEVDQSALDDYLRSVEDEGRTKDNPLGFQWMYRVGKRRAGRLLDGREHSEMPRSAHA